MCVCRWLSSVSFSKGGMGSAVPFAGCERGWLWEPPCRTWWGHFWAAPGQLADALELLCVPGRIWLIWSAVFALAIAWLAFAAGRASAGQRARLDAEPQAVRALPAPRVIHQVDLAALADEARPVRVPRVRRGGGALA